MSNETIGCDVQGCAKDAIAKVNPIDGMDIEARCYECLQFDAEDGRLMPLADPDA